MIYLICSLLQKPAVKISIFFLHDLRFTQNHSKVLSKNISYTVVFLTRLSTEFIKILSVVQKEKQITDPSIF